MASNWNNRDPEKRAKDARIYGTPEYKRARKACLERASYRCEIKYDDECTGRATQADHVYGASADPHHRHLRAGCEHCHGRVTAQQGGGARSPKISDPAPVPRTAW